MRKISGLFLLVGSIVQALLAPVATQACSRIGDVSPRRLVEEADVIVRATAEKYEKAPPENSWSSEPDSTISFKIREVIKGAEVPDTIILPGYLNDRDDFNDRPVPYDFVRPGGRGGNCFAITYKKGAEFLLLLKRMKDDAGFTPAWDALAPTNEQLRPSDEGWLKWVKEQVKQPEKDEPQARGFAILNRVALRLAQVLYPFVAAI